MIKQLVGLRNRLAGLQVSNRQLNSVHQRFSYFSFNFSEFISQINEKCNRFLSGCDCIAIYTETLLAVDLIAKIDWSDVIIGNWSLRQHL